MAERKLFQDSLIFYDILQSHIKMDQDKTFNLKQPLLSTIPFMKASWELFF